MQQHEFLDLVREALYSRPLSNSTRRCYLDWIYRYWLFHNKKDLRQMGQAGISTFLQDIVIKRRGSSSTHNQALSALLFFYHWVLNMDVALFPKNLRIERHLPVVLSRAEVVMLLGQLSGERLLMASLMYGCGLRLQECLSLRLRDINPEDLVIHVRSNHSGRTTLLPVSLISSLERQKQKATFCFEDNLQVPSFEGAPLYNEPGQQPDFAMQLQWQYLFPAPGLKKDTATGGMTQPHRRECWLQKAIAQAIQTSGIPKKASCRSLRHSFAVHLLENGYSVRTLQKLLGHKDVGGSMAYIHLIEQEKLQVQSPLDVL